MNIGVLGSGIVGRTLAAKLSELGHEVVIGTRDVEGLMARAEPDGMGNPPFSVWHKQHRGVGVKPFAGAAKGDLLLNCTNGRASLEVLRQAGADNLSGKVLVDVTNPLDFSRGMPPFLFVSNTDSLAEQIQRAFPEARVVKALNTMTAAVMVNPAMVAGGEHSVFVCGNDEAAKAEVTGLLQTFGWQDIIDLGDLTAARGMEMVLPIWLRVMGTLGTPLFNFKIAR